VKHDTIAPPTTPWVNPGTYTVTLTVDGKTYAQPLTVKLDPRVKTSAVALQQIYTVSKATYYAALDATLAAQRAKALREQIAKLRSTATGGASASLPQGLPPQLASLDKKLEGLVGEGARDGGPRDSGESLGSAGAELARVMNLLQDADVPPTTLKLGVISRARGSAARTMARWAAIKTVDIPAVNTALAAARLQPLAP
jgi:hypothetical protein